jgi:ABC-2 type transport system ATP-binding protein
VHERDLTSAVSFLQQQPLVQAISTVPADPRSLTIELTQTVNEEQCAGLLAGLVQAGVAISEFSARSESLEEFFLRLTMTDAR